LTDNHTSDLLLDVGLLHIAS